MQHKILSSYKDYLIYKKLNNRIEEIKTKHDVFINTDLLGEIKSSKDENVFGVDLYSYKMGLPYSRLAFAVPNRIWAAEFAWNSIYKN